MALASAASAQVKVTGRVTDLQHKPVGDVIVKLVSGSKTRAFTSTNAKGLYSLELKSVPRGEANLQFNHIGYEKESVPLSIKEGKPVVQDMQLMPKSIALKEVTVKADPLRQRGDTLTHNLAAFLGKGDVTLEDGLKRLPGVDVANSGAISYMGKPISQFNIEGLDLLGGKYSLATKNIPVDYVTQVDIVRNHHSRKVEAEEPSNEVSMNIKLSRKAKFKPFGQEEIGAGYMQDGNDKPQALLGLTGMMFTDKLQTICSLKGGNYKGFAHADMADHFGGSNVSTPATSLFGGFDGGAPPVGEYLYQRNGMATLNGISKLDSVTTLKVNADYSSHRATHDISQSSTYLAGAGSYMTVSEQASPLSKVHLPKLSVNYLKNADSVYLSETFVLKGKFERNEGNVLANGSQVEQRRRTSSFELGNDLYWVGKTKKGVRRHASASVSFKRTPTLNLSFANNGDSYGQTAQSSTLTMAIGSSFSIPIGKTFRISLPVRVSAAYDDLETNRANGSPPFGGGAGGEADANHIRGWSLTPTANPGFEIHSPGRRFYLSAGLGAALKGLYYNKLSYTKLVLNPSMGINYTFSANSKLQLSTGYTTRIGDMMTLLTEPMQVDYRTVRTSSGIIGEADTWRSSGDWKWQLPMQYFTFRLGASHNESKRNTLYSQRVSGTDISSSALRRDTRSRSTSFSVGSTKNFPSLFAKLGADAVCGFGSSEQAVSATLGEAADVIKVRSRSCDLHGNATVTPMPWLELRYDIRYGWSQTRYADSKNSAASLTHSGAVHLFPMATLDLSLDCDHVRRQIAADQHKRMSLFNASVQKKWKRCVLRLEPANLLNQHSSPMPSSTASTPAATAMASADERPCSVPCSKFNGQQSMLHSNPLFRLLLAIALMPAALCGPGGPGRKTPREGHDLRGSWTLKEMWFPRRLQSGISKPEPHHQPDGL